MYVKQTQCRQCSLVNSHRHSPFSWFVRCIVIRAARVSNYSHIFLSHFCLTNCLQRGPKRISFYCLCVNHVCEFHQWQQGHFSCCDILLLLLLSTYLLPYLLSCLLCLCLYRWWCWNMSVQKLWHEKPVKLSRFSCFPTNFLFHIIHTAYTISLAQLNDMFTAKPFVECLPEDWLKWPQYSCFVYVLHCRSILFTTR